MTVEEGMLACKHRWPLLYRAGVARYVMGYSEAGGRDYCRCSARQYRDRLWRLYGYLSGYLEARQPALMEQWLGST